MTANNSSDDECDLYLRYVGILAESSRAKGISAMEYIEDLWTAQDEELKRFLCWRHENFVLQDAVDAQGYLETGFFRGSDEGSRAAAFLLLFDVERKRRAIELEAALQRYGEDDRLFQAEPRLFDEVEKKKQLVSMKALTQIDRSGALLYCGEVVKVAAFLNPEILNFLISNGIPSEAVDVRLDPTFPSQSATSPIASYTAELPNEFLRVLSGVPLANFFVPRDIRTSPASSDPHEHLVDYYLNGVRRIELYGEIREKRANFFIEELTNESGIKISADTGEVMERSDGPLTGRLIHFDAFKSAGPCEEITLSHLDLAIQLYKGPSVRRRMEGKARERIDPTLRIHLLKIRRLPLSMLPGIAYLFLKSENLCRKLLQALRDR